MGFSSPSSPGLAVLSVTLGPGLPCSVVSVLSTDQQPEHRQLLSSGLCIALISTNAEISSPSSPQSTKHSSTTPTMSGGSSSPGVGGSKSCPFAVPGAVSCFPTVNSELVHLPVFFQDSSFPHWKTKQKYSILGL